jgi:hypothetical protein
VSANDRAKISMKQSDYANSTINSVQKLLGQRKYNRKVGKKKTQTSQKDAKNTNLMLVCSKFWWTFSASISIQQHFHLSYLAQCVRVSTRTSLASIPHVLHFYEHFFFPDQTIQK